MNEAVQKQLTAFFAGLNQGQSSAIQQPNFVLPVYAKEEKLQGSSNYSVWFSKLNTGLQSQNLLSFIQSEEGVEDTTIPESLQKIRDAQTLQYVSATVSSEICTSLQRYKTAYSAVKMLAITYGDQMLAETIKLERRQRRLTFRPWHDPIRFMNEFDAIIHDYDAIGIKYDDDPLIAKLLAMIDIDTGGPENQYLMFYNMIQTLPKQFRTFEAVRTRFLNYKQEKIKKPVKKDQQQRPVKRFQPDTYSHTEPPPLKSRDRRTIADLTNGKTRVTMEDLYSLDQRSRLSKMTSAEKAENRCAVCNVYFHRAESCPYKKKLCSNCFHFGHSQLDCKQGEESYTLCTEPSSSQSCNNLTKPNNIIKLFAKNVTFIVDSGATHHAVADEKLIREFQSYENPKGVKLAIKAEN